MPEGERIADSDGCRWEIVREKGWGTAISGRGHAGPVELRRSRRREVFDLRAAGKTKVIREVRPLVRVNESIADVEAGRVAARIVFAP